MAGPLTMADVLRAVGRGRERFRDFEDTAASALLDRPMLRGRGYEDLLDAPGAPQTAVGAGVAGALGPAGARTVGNRGLPDRSRPSMADVLAAAAQAAPGGDPYIPQSGVETTATLGRHIRDIPQRAIEASENFRLGGSYDPGPVLEGASLLAPGGLTTGGTLGALGGRLRPAAADVLLNRQRTMFPGVYKDPRALAEEMAARAAPEDPALKQLFGVSRQDLYDIGQARGPGNITPQFAFAANPKGSAAATNIMTPANAQRLIDANAEFMARYPDLARGVQAWYVMDPAFQRMVQLVGPQQAIADYRRLNALSGISSRQMSPLQELNRGTAANMMAAQGRFPEFAQFGGAGLESDQLARALQLRGAGARTPGYPPELLDVGGKMGHVDEAEMMRRYLETGQMEMESAKVPAYVPASGVPQTGFQTAWAVPDAHYGRALGLPDVRTGKVDLGASLSVPEYQQVAPWWRQQVTQPLGIEAVPGQAQTWTLYGPQTGVRSPAGAPTLGAPKLELLAGAISRRAQQLGMDPAALRDQVLTGAAHATVGGLTLGDVLLSQTGQDRGSYWENPDKSWYSGMKARGTPLGTDPLNPKDLFQDPATGRIGRRTQAETPEAVQ